MHLNKSFGGILALLTFVKALPSPGQVQKPSCRFAHQYSQKEIIRDPTAFINDLLFWEGKFHQNNISYNSNNGITYDGTNIDWVTGEATIKHSTSAASKEVCSKVDLLHRLSGQLIEAISHFKSCSIHTLLPDLQKLLDSFPPRTQQQPQGWLLLSCRRSCRHISGSIKLSLDSVVSCLGSWQMVKI